MFDNNIQDKLIVFIFYLVMVNHSLGKKKEEGFGNFD